MTALTAPVVSSSTAPLVDPTACRDPAIVDASPKTEAEAQSGEASAPATWCPPLKAFAFRPAAADITYDVRDDDDDDDESDTDDSLATAASQEDQQRTVPLPVREGAAVRFRADPVAEVRIRARTSEDERAELFYRAEDFRRFRGEYRAALRARRAARLAATGASGTSGAPARSETTMFASSPLTTLIGSAARTAASLVYGASSAVPDAIARAESISRQRCQQGSDEQAQGTSNATLVDTLYLF